MSVNIRLRNNPISCYHFIISLLLSKQTSKHALKDFKTKRKSGIKNNICTIKLSIKLSTLAELKNDDAFGVHSLLTEKDE